MNKIDNILDYLNKLYPNGNSELIYEKDYELLIAVVLSAQTTDKRVNQVTSTLFKKYPTLKDLKNASILDLYTILRPLGMHKKKSQYVRDIAKILDEKYYGIVPETREELKTIPGVGRKTANLVLAIIYNKPFIAVDTHVSRVARRLKLVKEKDNVLTIEKKLNKLIPTYKRLKAHYQLVMFGRYHCKAIKPNCSECLLKDICKLKKAQ